MLVEVEYRRCTGAYICNSLLAIAFLSDSDLL